MAKRKTETATVKTYAVAGSDEAEVKGAAADLAKKLAPPDAGHFGAEIIAATAAAR